jgi:hypothetical protein
MRKPEPALARDVITPDGDTINSTNRCAGVKKSERPLR